MQTEIDFTHPHNNRESDIQFDENIGHFQTQTERVLAILQSGETITSLKAYGMGIIDVRARIKQIRDSGINVKDRKIVGGRGAKEYYIETKS